MKLVQLNLLKIIKIKKMFLIFFSQHIINSEFNLER